MHQLRLLWDLAVGVVRLGGLASRKATFRLFDRDTHGRESLAGLVQYVASILRLVLFDVWADHLVISGAAGDHN